MNSLQVRWEVKSSTLMVMDTTKSDVRKKSRTGDVITGTKLDVQPQQKPSHVVTDQKWFVVLAWSTITSWNSVAKRSSLPGNEQKENRKIQY